MPDNEDNDQTLTTGNLDELPLPSTELYYPNEEDQAVTGFTPMIVEEILKHTSLGCNLMDCASITRLPPSRVYNWYTKNYCNFKFSIDYHRADNKRRILKVVTPGANGDKIPNATESRNSLFLLERRYKDEYGKEIKVEVNTVMIDNIMGVVFESAKKFIPDPEKLKQFVEDVSIGMGLIKPSEGMPDGQRLIS